MNDLIPFLLFAVSSAFTPGPNNFMLLNAGLHFGVRKSLPHFWGICLGFPVMVLLVAIGLGAVFIEFEWVKQALKIIGSIYMLYLAYQIIRTSNKNKPGHEKKPLSFMQACLFQWVNPKAWLMGVGAISIFTLSDNYLANAMLISGIYIITCIPCSGAWLVFGSEMQRFLKTERHRRWFNIAMAVCLVASIAMIYVE